jgi:hypothetical protein
MDAPVPPNPPSLGRQQDGAEGFVHPYGQNICPNIQPESVRTWHPPLAAGWEPSPYAPALGPVCSLSDLDKAGAELRLLREVYGDVLDKDGKPYGTFQNNGIVLDVERYLRDRDAFIGPGTTYDAYRDKALAELDADGGKLRSRILPIEKRDAIPRWREAQVPFYMWIRRGYENALGRNSSVHIPTLIRTGTSQKLRDALKQVRSDYGQNFPQQADLVARPIKLNYNYKLGTLSDHALGRAVDIDPEHNAQIRESDWKDILTLTGESLDQATRTQQWSATPQALHTAIARINDAFVAKVRELIEAQTEAPDPLKAAIAANPTLARLNKGFSIKKWRQGFFNLEWNLVKELHEESLVWGATFKHPDLHHFELPSSVPLL